MTYFLWLIDKCKVSGLDFDLDLPRPLIKQADKIALELPHAHFALLCDNWYGYHRN